MITDRIECKIHGGFWWATLVTQDDTQAVVEVMGAFLTLPLVSDSRGIDNCAIRR